MQVLDSTLFMNTKLLLGVMITPSNNFVFITIIGPISTVALTKVSNFKCKLVARVTIST